MDDFDHAAHIEQVQAGFRATGLIKITEFPDVELVRIITMDERLEVWYSCMQDAGWNVSITPDGGMASPRDLHESQFEAYTLADYACEVKYPVSPNMYERFGEPQVGGVYTYYIESLKPCLEREGFDISEPPTWPTFFSTWQMDLGSYAATNDTWNPYVDVELATMGEADLNVLLETCPMSIPEEYLYSSE